MKISQKDLLATYILFVVLSVVNVCYFSKGDFLYDTSMGIIIISASIFPMIVIIKLFSMKKK
ncbi:hypothetical protein D9Q25_01790 [Salmonella enterica subsp. enterica serovar Javiana]|nr:hypothetical protein [Salmonella enterica]EBZ2992978.1 hypothetical protein [Salmonella enterica subsp. enterica serovar Javiana]ECH9651383.1 hypothetical protein [Salmonella enterica subsp. enterica serovar Miami]EAU5970992.1 hypothetical protein [Salmonella enterica]EBM4432477.1 hypothetical protein [Salmonella enterica]